MTHLSNKPATKAPAGNGIRPTAVWGGQLLCVTMGAIAALLVWLEGDLFGLTSRDARVSVLVWIPLAVVLAIVVFLVAVFLGADKMIARQFAREAHDVSRKALRKQKFDPRLEMLCEDLRIQFGWRWRYRMPWLMLSGDEIAINEVVPRLKQTGAWWNDEVVLLHPAPEGIDAQAWRKQIRKLRRRRPVDATVQLVAADAAAESEAEPLRVLRAMQEHLGWAAPITFLHPVRTKPWQIDQGVPVGVYADDLRGRSRGSQTPDLHDMLVSLETQVAAMGVLSSTERTASVVTKLSAYIGQYRSGIAIRWATWQASRWRCASLAGVMFAPACPVPADVTPVPVEAVSGMLNRPAHLTTLQHPHKASASMLATWREIGQHSKRYRGRRLGKYQPLILPMALFAAIALWMTGMVVSGLRNAANISAVQQSIRGVQEATAPDSDLRALLALQQQIQRYEYRTEHGAPLLTRFGLNRDAETLAALWNAYKSASRRILLAPVQQALEASLVELTRMRTDLLDEQAGRLAQTGQDALKAYLMLAQPERAEAAFLAPQMLRHWSTNARMPAGERQDTSERLVKFYADHVKSNPVWKIEPAAEFVAAARRALLAVVGQRNAQDTVYQSIIQGFADNGGHGKYPDKTLALLTAGTDPRGLVRSEVIVPGVFTREAYDDHIAPAIEAAAHQSVIADDWVLTDGTPPMTPDRSLAGEDLKAALTEQYFADYAERWQGFMNSLQWEPAPTMPGAIDQLKLLADARQSPVVALMKSLEYHGRAGVQRVSLTDTLVSKAKGILGKTDDKRFGVQQADPAGPLGATFGPVFRLLGQDGEGGGGDLSLTRFLDRATALRLRLQQVNNSSDGDAQARHMAQALFQGKGSELADTHAYAQLIAASLGAQWAGMGEALFIRPIAQASQAVLQPAQANLNEVWRQSIATPWGRAFAGRYPFSNTSNDASLPELARFLRPQVGLIDSFISTQLAGVLERRGDQWVTVGVGAQGATIDPDFLKAINTLQRLASRMLAEGEPQYRFELKPVPTSGLTETVLKLDGQTLHYYNQRETWQAMTWPARNLQEPGTRLQWRAETAGTSKNYEFGGRLGWLRMLERAHVVPIDSATFELSWKAAPDAAAEVPEVSVPTDPESLTARDARISPPAEMVYPILYQMRTESGHGPLEMLFLRGFVMPSQVFITHARRETSDVRQTS